jgi:hypothetical protein
VPKVLQIASRLGPFKFEAYSGKNQLEKRYFTKISPEGIHYEGEWILGTNIREGRGVQLWPDGSRYEGNFKGGT